jgi:hypothetical protein
MSTLRTINVIHPSGTTNNIVNDNLGSVTIGNNLTVTGDTTFGSSIVVPTVIGGTTASSTLTLESTSGTGTSDSILFKTGSQSTRMSIDTSGNVGIATGNLTFSGTGQRITGDFSNATIANRVLFQTSTVNGNTLVRAIPNGTSTQANIAVANSSDPANCSIMQLVAASTTAQIQSGVNGTGTYLPMTFFTGGSEQVRIGATAGTDLGTVGIGYSTLTGVGVNGLAVAGNVGIGTSSPGYKLDVGGGTGLQVIRVNGASSGTNAGSAVYMAQGGSTNTAIGNYSAIIGGAYDATAYVYSSGAFGIKTGGGTGYNMYIDSSGNVGIGASPGTNANNIQPLTVYSQGPSNLTIKQGTSSSPKTASNSPLIWAQNYIKYDTPGDPFAQNVGGVFADVEVVNDATPGTQINGTWNAIIGNSVNNGVNWGTSTSQNWSTKGSAIGVTGFARANGFPGDSQIITGLWGYPQGPTLDATTYANLPSGANWSLCGVEVNIQINHPDIGEKSLLVGQGSSVGALLSNYRTAGTGVRDWTFGVVYAGSPDDGNYSSTNVDNWNGFYCGILLDKIKAKGIRFGQYFKNGSYGIYFPDSYAGTQEPAAAIYMGNSKINMGQYTGSSFNNQDFWHNSGQLYWKYGGLTFPLMQMASPYTATVTALAGYILVKDDAGNYRKVAVMT